MEEAEKQKRLAEKKQEIIKLLEKDGPSVPAKLSSRINMPPLFVSAILSEMVGNGMLKLTHMKIGGSPLYYLPGQERMLERFIDFLSSVEKETVLLLKKKKMIKDTDLTPAQRVAMRNLKDFARPLQHGKELFWVYYTENVKLRQKLNRSVSQHLQHHTPPSKICEAENVARNFLEEKGIVARDVIEKTKNRILMNVDVKTQIGVMRMLLFCIKKKRISTSDVALVIEKVQEDRTPAIFLTVGKLSKNALEKMERFKNLVLLHQVAENKKFLNLQK